MIILSIETSCDDTGVAIVEKRKEGARVLASALSSQDEVHKKWGGVHPSEAKREHQNNLLPTLKKALSDSCFLKKRSAARKINIPEWSDKITVEKIGGFLSEYEIKGIDAIAVTVGPGLEPCLWQGINFARALSYFLKLPIIPVNHIKGHVFSFLLQDMSIDFPAIALIVSGGHTELILMNSFHDFRLIGKTRDDAAGECFDKTARILGLSYPGGPEISKRAKSASSDKYNITLPRPMINSPNYDFSFSGLKTAVLYDSKKRKHKDSVYIEEMSKEIEEAITDVLTAKLKKAMEEYKAKVVILGGGVVANKRLREKIKEMTKNRAELLLPELRFCTDNAEMIGAAATVEKKRESYDTIKPNANLTAY